MRVGGKGHGYSISSPWPLSVSQEFLDVVFEDIPGFLANAVSELQVVTPGFKTLRSTGGVSDAVDLNCFRLLLHLG